MTTSLSTHTPGAERPGRPTTTHPRPAAPLTRTAVVGVAAFFVAALITGVATPGYSARLEAVSALAARDAAWAPVMIAGFLLLAVGLAATGLALWRVLPARAGRASATLILLTAGLMAVAGLARQDCSDQRPSCRDFGEAAGASTSYWVHQYAALLGFLLLVVALFLLARGIRRVAAAPRLVVPARIVATMSLLLTALVIIGPPPVQAAFGIVQRVFLLVIFGWPVVVAVLHQRRAAEAAREPVTENGAETP